MRPALGSRAGSPAAVARVIVAAPRGFCAGVTRAVDIVEAALERWGPPVYVRKEIVHNRRVVGELAAKGAIFVDEVDQAPADRPLIFSAHGIAPTVRVDAASRQLRTIDATCPLVTKVHSEAKRFARQGYELVYIGHEGHDEALGTMGGAGADAPGGDGGGRRAAGPAAGQEGRLPDPDDSWRG